MISCNYFYLIIWSKKRILCWGGGQQSSPTLTGTVIFLLLLLSSLLPSLFFLCFIHPSVHLSVSLLGQTASSLICQSFFFSIYLCQSLSIQALSNIMPEPIKSGGGEEWMLSSSPVSCQFLVQFQVSFWPTMHNVILLLFYHGLAWWLLYNNHLYTVICFQVTNYNLS